MVKISIALLALVTMLGCTEPKQPEPEHTQSLTSEPPLNFTNPHLKVKGKTHWTKPNEISWVSLVCNNTGLVLGSVDPMDGYTVFGGNGAEYGEYATLQQAKDHVESMVNNPPSQFGSDYFQCWEEQ